MPEKPKQNINESNPHTVDDVAGEYGYLEYLIEKKFHRRFKGYWIVLLSVLSIFGLLSINTFVDLKAELGAAERANERIQAAYQDLLLRDSLDIVRSENAEYWLNYSPYGPDNHNWRPAINQRFEDLGFGYSSSGVEDSVNWYLYDIEGLTSTNAYRHILRAADSSSNRIIALAYNGVPRFIFSRIESVFRDVYGDSLEFFYASDTLLPEKVIMYYISTPQT